MDHEQPLAGGNASGPVYRVGSTVRKPWTEASSSVLDFMAAVKDAGVDVPAALGRDSRGRQMTEFVPGEPAIDSDPLTDAELARVGGIVRAIHDASQTYTPAPSAVWHTGIASPGDELVCHNDLAPWNLILGPRWTFIDWDASAPSTRLWDLAYAAQTFTLSDPEQPPEDAARRLAALVGGYDADEELRAALPAAMSQRTAAMFHLLRSSNEVGIEPWGSMFEEGHGDHWGAVTDYVRNHHAVWSRALDE
ncbi:phosphotransferase [Nesterenkonia sp. E16_7]|nr:MULTISPECIES: phosphotransferase [unclassified Nesterenkonia]MBO0596475.1 phosphotransferase [Nesterenkonia sp. E16_10]MBO0597821.1 phosphotransferase [Nesterenkonia sp. E16_7]